MVKPTAYAYLHVNTTHNRGEVHTHPVEDTDNKHVNKCIHKIISDSNRGKTVKETSMQVERMRVMGEEG